MGRRRTGGTKFGGYGTCLVGVCGHLFFFFSIYCFFLPSAYFSRVICYRSTQVWVVGGANHEHVDCGIQREKLAATSYR